MRVLSPASKDGQSGPPWCCCVNSAGRVRAHHDHPRLLGRLGLLDIITEARSLLESVCRRLTPHSEAARAAPTAERRLKARRRREPVEETVSEVHGAKAGGSARGGRARGGHEAAASVVAYDARRVDARLGALLARALRPAAPWRSGAASSARQGSSAAQLASPPRRRETRQARSAAAATVCSKGRRARRRARLATCVSAAYPTPHPVQGRPRDGCPRRGSSGHRSGAGVRTLHAHGEETASGRTSSGCHTCVTRGGAVAVRALFARRGGVSDAAARAARRHERRGGARHLEK